MKKTSLDGRNPKAKNDQRKAKLALLEPLKSPQDTNLKPASPPKSNPWLRAQDTGSELQQEDQNFPPLNSQKSKKPPTPPSTNTEDKDSQVSAQSPITPLSPETQALSKAGETVDTASTTSTSSRKLFEGAAPRVGETLWTHPFGADVLVHAESTVFQVHRDIIQPQSGWLRDHLPPPHADGSPVAIKLPYAAGAVACCLRYTYTYRVEICEPDELHTLNIVHIPRCVLSYLAAVWLRVDKMMWHLIKIVEKTAIELGDYLRTKPRNSRVHEGEAASFIIHLRNALDVTYGEPVQRLMKPMRMALAAVLDTCMIFLLQQPRSAELLNSKVWQRHSPAICADQVEYRHLLGQSHPLQGSAVPGREAMKVLLEGQLAGRAGVEADICSYSGVKGMNDPQ